MKIHEHQAKELLAKFGVPIPRAGGVAATPAEARAAVEALGGTGVLKAQVHVGGRGKGGGIQIAGSPAEAEALAERMIGMLLKTHQAPDGVRVSRLLVEETVRIARELYLGIVPDRNQQRFVLILSTMGGMDIEAVAEEHPEAIARLAVDPAQGLRDYQARGLCFEAGVDGALTAEVAALIGKLWRAFLESDASLAEINPLALTDDGRLLAADAKIQIDDNALFRHPEFDAWKEENEEDPIEAEAHRRGIQYVRLDGAVGVIGNGAGLVMATLDEVARAGGKAANFLDIGGGARADLVRNALEIVLMDPRVRAVFVNIFGGITRGDEVARGILAAAESMEIRVPLVVRLAGTRAAEGAELLRNTRLVSADTMQEAAAKAVALAT